MDIVYDGTVDEKIMLKDIRKHHIGLFIVSQKMFSNKIIRTSLYKSNVPVLKFADRSFSTLKKSVVILGEENHVEHISTTIFDVASQLGFDLELIDYVVEDRTSNLRAIEHFNNLSQIFSKSIRVIETEENPIRLLREKDNFLQCLPFTEKMFANSLKRFFATDSEILYTKLDSYHQLFIPTQI